MNEIRTLMLVSDEKLKGSRLIALNRASFDLIEIVEAQGFGPDIYYYYYYYHYFRIFCQRRPMPHGTATALGERSHDQSALVSLWWNSVQVMFYCVRVYPRANQTRHSSSHEPFAIRTSLVTRSGIRKHSY